MLAPPPAQTINEVVAQLDEIIALPGAAEPMGYFAALYRV